MSISVVQVNTDELAGGASRIAQDLNDGLQRLGERSFMAVGRKQSRNASVRLIDNNAYRGEWFRALTSLQARLSSAPIEFPGKRGVGFMLGTMALPSRALAARRGVEFYGYPATWHPEDWAAPANLLHLHNLHGGFFDLRALPALTSRFPVVLTMHDAWMLSGRCAHSLDCERWRTGCGACPDLNRRPAARRDQTARSWRAKRDIYAKSRLRVATPSRWLMAKVEASMLAPAVVESRVIPHGVDLQTFRPQDQRKARERLGLPAGAHIVVFAAHGGRTNTWKDFATIEAAAVDASRTLSHELVLVAIGDEAGDRRQGNLRLLSVPHLSHRAALARYLAAADVCAHAAHAETFSLWLAESLSCGTPAVSVRVGAIPEVVKHGVTGLLVDPGDATSFGRSLVTLLSDDDLRAKMGNAAAHHAERSFGLERMVEEYRQWYYHLAPAAEESQ